MICINVFQYQRIPSEFCTTEHLLLPNIYVNFVPEYYIRIRVSIENIPLEQPDREVKNLLSKYHTPIGKTYYPGITHNNKHFTPGTRAYNCIKLRQYIPRQLYKFSRYLRICYDSQPNNNSNPTNNNQLPPEETPVPAVHETQQT